MRSVEHEELRTKIADLADKYRNELMTEEARLELRDLVRRLKRKLKEQADAEAVDAHHSGLERLI